MTAKEGNLFDISAARQRLQTAAAGDAKQTAWKDVVKYLGLGLGAGVAGRAALGIAGAATAKTPKPPVGQPVYLDVPFPDDREKPAGFLAGDNATTASGVPWHFPALMTGVPVAAALGWKGLDAVLDARRKSKMRQETDQAKQEFEQALMSQYDRPKQASADAPLGEVLEVLFGRVKEGISQLLSLSDDTKGMGVGAAGAYAGLSGGLAAMLAYNMTKKHQRRKLLEKAEQLRAKRLAALRPPEIYARPVPFQPGAEGLPNGMPDKPLALPSPATA